MSDKKAASRGHILVVEDSRTQAEELRYLLEKHGFQVRVAGDAEAALAAIGEAKPDLVISDVVMPGMDGFQLCRKIKSTTGCSAVPVIIVTSLGDPKDVVRGLQCGADNFVTKPYDEEAVLRRVDFLLASRHLDPREMASLRLQVNFGGEEYHIDSHRMQIVNMLLSSYETAVQRDAELLKAQEALRLLNEGLERKVEERTAAFTREIAERKAAQARELHVNAVLRAIRNVNQLITREKDRDRLLQQACTILIESRGFLCVWAVRLGADGRVEATAEAGIGAGFAGLRAEIEAGRLPECCRRALAAAAPVVIPNSLANCVACPLATQYRDTVALAAPLRHEGRTYGVLVAALPAEMAENAEEISLFQEAAGDLAFALHDIEIKEERQRAVTALWESEERYRTLFENAQDGIGLAEAETGTLVECNPALCRMVGRERAELVGQVQSILHPPSDISDGLSTTFRRHQAENAGTPMETRLLSKSGEQVPVEIRADRVHWNGHDYLLGVFRDITERQRAEEERQRLQAQLVQSQKLESIGTLAGGVAHEINNPINGIMNYAQLIADRLEAQSPLREYAAEIIKETDRVSSIVRNLLTFSRHDKQSHSPARVRDIVDSTLSLMCTVIRHDQITLEVDVPEDMPKIRCRCQQIQQVLMNLLTNARDALNEKYPGYHEDKIVRVTAREVGSAEVGTRNAERGGREVISDQLSVISGQPRPLSGVEGSSVVSGGVGEKTPISDLRPAGVEEGGAEDRALKPETRNLKPAPVRWLRLTVEDHGPGILSELRDRIFEPFFTTKPRDKGTGLGLSISQGIVKDHGGVLWLESEVGKFTRLHVDLPVGESAEGEEEQGGRK